MTTAAPPSADTDILADVDASHTPVCQVFTRYAEHTRWGKCRREASWVARIPCCGGFSLLVCRHHHDSPSPWSCRKCNRSIGYTEIGWVQL